MSDVRFSCAHCQQHLECDDAWCGNVIACPACGQEIQVPHFVVFAGGDQPRLPAALPAGSRPMPRKTRSSPEAYSRAYGLYSESDWNQAASACKPASPRRYNLGIIVIVSLVALSLAFGGSGLVIIALVLGSAIGAGALLEDSDDFLHVTSRVLLTLILLAAVAVGVLFVGCGGSCNDL
jgi:hypothetical protein